MSSDVDICNTALARVGGDFIAALDDNTNEALLCNRLYPTAKDYVLSLHQWNSTVQRVELAETAETPLFYFAHSYQLPINILKVWEIEGFTEPYRIEGRLLLTDKEPPCRAIISIEVDDPNALAPYLRETISYYLAHLLSTKINSNESRTKNLYEIYNRELTRAKFLDSQEGSIEQPTWLGSWNQSRFAGSGCSGQYNYPNWGYAPPGGF